MFRIILLCLLLAVLPGCAAIGARESGEAARPYAGIRDDSYYLVHPSEADVPVLQLLNILDMPFSFVVDTVCLPYDLAALK